METSLLDACLRRITSFSVEASIEGFIVIDVSVTSGPSFTDAKSAFLVQYSLDKPACYQTRSGVSTIGFFQPHTHIA